MAVAWGADLQVLTLIKKGQIPLGMHRLIRKQVDRIELEASVSVRSVSYTVAEDIAGEFDLVDNTFVVMSSWARGRAAGIVANVAEDVFRLVRRPMLLTGPEVDIDDEWPNGPMYIGVDGTHFSESVVRAAAELAVSLSVEPRVLTVIDPAAVPAGANPAAETNSLAAAAAAAESITGSDVTYDALHGSDPAAEIVDYAKRYGASVIAMSTHVRSGAARLLHGSVAMDVVSHAHCPVLIDRPPSDDESS